MSGDSKSGRPGSTGRAGRPRTGDETSRDDIQLAAAALFARRGYHGVGMREIAEKLGVRAPSLYHHFRSKDDLLYQIARDMQAWFSEVCLPPLADPSLSRAEGVSAFIDCHIRNLWRHRQRVAVGVREYRWLDAPRRREIDAMRGDYQRALREFIASGVEEAEFEAGDPLIASFVMLESMNGIYDWYKPDRGHTIGQIVESHVDLLVYGMLRAERDPETASGAAAPAT